MKVGDLVTWTYDENHPLGDLQEDVGLITIIEEWKYEGPPKKVIKVLFARGGFQWCNEKALKIVSSARDMCQTRGQ